MKGHLTMRDIILYATDTMADWEYGYLTAALAMAQEMDPGQFRFRVLGDGAAEVTTKGRLRLQTDGDLGEVELDEVALLVLPGADTWFDGHDKALGLAAALVECGRPVAAICGATYGLARAGILDARSHTSNAAEFLAVSGYAGGDHYVDQRVVDADGLITAPATAPIDFTAAILSRIEAIPPAMIDAWFGLYTTGEKRFYDALTGTDAA